MSAHKNRIATMAVLVSGSSALSHAEKASVDDELNELRMVGAISPLRRRRIFEVFHASRATEAVLRAAVYNQNCFAPSDLQPYSIGSYLYALHCHVNPNHQKLTAAERHHYQNNIARKRNRFLHKAAEYPTGQQDVAILLADMHTCISRVITL